MKQKVTFITSNKNKAHYLSRLLKLEISHKKLELTEIQSVSLKDVVEDKSKRAYEVIKTPVIVEDVSLEFAALGILPGTFIKFFIDYAGLESVCRLLEGFENKKATARCGYGYYDGSRFAYFEGSLGGSISDKPGAELVGFGWDRIFKVDIFDNKIRSELTQKQYDETYLKIKPIKQLREFLIKNGY